MLDNFNYRTDTTDETVLKEILKKQAYRKKKIDFKIEEDDVWLDGGGHIGIFALYAAQNKAKKVYCYEPEDENFDLLLKNAELIESKTTTDIECVKAGITQTTQTCNFTIAPNTWRHSLLTHYKKKLPTKQIQCISIDEILKQHQDINCIKLDIEGSELEILKNDHDFSNIKKLVFEYSFTKDRSMENFFFCVNKLSKYFEVDVQKSFHNQSYQGVKGLWGGFIDNIIFCKKK